MNTFSGWSHPEVCCDPGSSDAGHQEQKSVVVLVPRECDVSLAQATVVLVSATGSLQCPYRLLVL